MRENFKRVFSLFSSRKGGESALFEDLVFFPSTFHWTTKTRENFYQFYKYFIVLYFSSLFYFIFFKLFGNQTKHYVNRKILFTINVLGFEKKGWNCIQIMSYSMQFSRFSPNLQNFLCNFFFLLSFEIFCCHICVRVVCPTYFNLFKI